VNTLDTAARLTGYLMTAFFFGGLLFIAVLWPRGAEERRIRWALTTACAIGGASALTRLAIQHDTETDAGRLAVALPLLWLLAAIVLSAVLQRGPRATASLGWRLAAVVVGFGLVRTTAMAWHTEDGGWGSALATAHLAAVTAWLGGLAVVLAGLLPRGAPDELAHAIPRFSRWALIAVIVIVGSGAVLAWRLVGSWRALLDTSYGSLLLTKLVLLGLVLAVAQRSKSWVDSRLRVAVVLRGDAATVRPFVVTVAAETALLLAVVVAATLLVTAVPGR
jgi:copper transport protein